MKCDWNFQFRTTAGLLERLKLLEQLESLERLELLNSSI